MTANLAAIAFVMPTVCTSLAAKRAPAAIQANAGSATLAPAVVDGSCGRHIGLVARLARQATLGSVTNGTYQKEIYLHELGCLVHDL